MIIAPNGRVVALTTSDISIVEPGLAADQIIFTVVSSLGGQIERAGAPGVPITTFTQADVNDRLIRFASDGSTLGPLSLSYVDSGGVTQTLDIQLETPTFPTIEISGLNGANGTTFIDSAAMPGSYVGNFIDTAGDFNGDGFEDFLISSAYDNSGVGAAFVVFGGPDGQPGQIDLQTLDGTDGFRIEGVATGDNLGFGVVGLGDINNDGIDDIGFGAPGVDVGNYANAGTIYVLYGTSDPIAATISGAAASEAAGFQITGGEALDRLPQSLEGDVDFNGDGVGDIIALSTTADGYDRVTVIFGVDGGPSGNIDLGNFGAADGVTIDGVENLALRAGDVVGIGDFNGDNIGDIIIGAPRLDGAVGDEGGAYVVFGSATPGATIDLNALDGTNGFRVLGEGALDSTGQTVGSGDFNGDGLTDVLISSRGYNAGTGANSGAVFVIFGATTAFAATSDLADLDGTNGFRIQSGIFGDYIGRAVNAGDVNGDGIDDILFGASGVDPDGRVDAGVAGILFGSTQGFGAVFDMNTIDGQNGFFINGETTEDFLGLYNAAAGDVNGDGFADLLVSDVYGAVNVGNAYTGRTHLVLGGQAFDAANVGGDRNVLVRPGGQVVLTVDDLTATESQTTSPDLLYDVEALDGVTVAFIADPAAPITRFSQADLEAGEVLVVSDGSSPSGSFAVTVTDNEGEVTPVISLAVAAPPPIDGDLELKSPEGGRVAVTTNDLSAFIDGVAADATTVTVTTITGGQLELATNPGVAITSFTQADVEAKLVRFVDQGGDGVGSFDVSLETAPGVFETATVDVIRLETNGTFSVTGLDGSNGFIVQGALNFQRTGTDIGAGADINADGFADLFIATGGTGNNGYVVLGDGGAFGPTLDLAAIDGTDGFSISGAASGENLGFAITGAGDINGDGIDDFIIGASERGVNDNGAAYVFFGTTGGFPSDLSIGSLDGTNGFAIGGADTGDYLGAKVASGDVNGDGLADIVIGANQADGEGNLVNRAGEIHVIFGSDLGFGATFDVGTLDGSNGFTFFGTFTDDFIPFDLAVGDVNADGFDDIISGSPLGGLSGSTGRVDVVFGSDSGFASLTQDDLNGANGFSVFGRGTFDSLSPVTTVDINGDGLQDLVIGNATASGVNYGNVGEVYILFGTTDPFPDTFDLNALDGTTGFTIKGVDTYAVSRVGEDVAGGVDVNGDGIEDLLIGADNGDGVTFVVFGSRAGFEAEFELSQLNASTGLVINGTGSDDFYQVGAIGDLNGDGFDDFAIGGKFAAPQGRSAAGETAVIFGLQTHAPAVITGDLFTEVTRNGVVTVTTELLNAVDAVSAAPDITYHVGFSSNGRFALASDPTTEITTFTQQDVNDGLIVAVNNGAASNGFITISATDGDGDVTDNFNFTLNLVSAATIGGDLVIMAPDAESGFVGGRQVALTINDVLGAEGGLTSDQVLIRVDAISGGRLERLGAEGVAITTFFQDEVEARDIRFVDTDDTQEGGFIDLRITDSFGINRLETITVREAEFNAPGLVELDATEGTSFYGEFRNEFVGYDLSAAGDVNGDGFDDILIGSMSYRDENGAYGGGGKAYVVFGGPDASYSIPVSQIDGTNGFRIDGVNSYDYLGLAVTDLGDVNGDGIDDFAIAASPADPPGRSNAGEVYVIFGTTNGFAPVFDVSTLDGTNGFVIQGANAGDRIGGVLDGADVNGDGFADILMSALSNTTNGTNAGAAFVLFGSDQGFSATVDLAAIGTTEGLSLFGPELGDFFGFISDAGDFNGDGVGDFIIGARGGDDDLNALNSVGETYLIFGDAGLGGTFDLSTLDGTNGVLFLGESDNDQSGESVSNAGDLNGDGFDDILIGAAEADPLDPNTGAPIYSAGKVYVVFGTDQLASGEFRLSTLDASSGLIVEGKDQFDRLGDFRSINAAGDLDGDGVDDIVLGAGQAEVDGTSYLGEVYILPGDVIGLPATINVADLATIGGATINGPNTVQSIGYSISDAGDFNGDGIADIMFAGQYFYENGQFNAGRAFVVYGAGSSAPTIGGDLNVAVAAGGTVAITAADLLGEDPASDPADILFNVVGATDAFVALAAAPTVAIDRFTQAQVDANEVVFVSTAGAGAPDAGSIQLRAVDRFGDTSIEGTGAVPAAVLSSTLAAAATISGDLSIDALDGGRVALTMADLLGEEVGLTPGDITFTASAITGGQLEFASDPGVAITEFTQQDINDKNIRFVDAAGAPGGSFDVTLTDQGGLTVTETVVVTEAAPFVYPDTGLNASGGALTLDGVNGFAIVGAQTDSGSFPGTAGSTIGRVIETAGDVNGDGFDDIIVGARDDARGGVNSIETSPGVYEYYYEGVSYVVFGGPAGGTGLVDLGDLPSADGFRLPGTYSFEALGDDVSSVGDVNGDGIEDFAVVTRGGYAPNRYAGDVFIVFGNDAGFSGDFEVRDLDGTNGFRLIGEQNGASIREVAAAGDFNDDGIDDFLIAVPNSDVLGRERAGEFFVVFGRDDGGFAATVDLEDFNARDGLRIFGADALDYGEAMAAAGDVNGDGIDDVLLSALGADPNGVDRAGSNFVVFGSEDAGGVLDLRDIDGVNGARFDGVTSFGRSGLAVAGGHDFNGDGFADMVFGEQFYDGPTGGPNIDPDDTGAVFVVFGGTSIAAVTALNTLDGTNGFRVEGRPGDDLGNEIELLKDFNGDGLADLVIGAEQTTVDGVDRAGEVFILYGRETSPGPVVTLDDGNFDGVNGARFYGTETFVQVGLDVASGGDVNGDGLTDLLIGARTTDYTTNGREGAVFVLFGDNGPAPNVTGDLQVEVNPAGTVIVGVEDLFGAELGSGDADLVYHVTDSTNGFVAFGFDPSTARLSFTQAELAAGDVAFVHDGGVQAGSFTVELTDADGDISAPVTVLAPTVSEATVAGDLTIASLSGVGAVLTAADLLGTLPGFAPDELVYAVASIEGGQLELTSAPGVTVTSFTQDDVDARLVRFSDDPTAVGGGIDLSITDDIGLKTFVSLEVLEAQADSFDIDDLNGGNGFVSRRTDLQTYSYTGYSGEGIGDINGDGFDDIAFTSQYSAGNFTYFARVHVLFGSDQGFPTEFDVNSIDGTNGFVIGPLGDRTSGSNAPVISALGDVNGDGMDDFIVQDVNATDDVESFVIFGTTGPFDASFDLTTLDGTNGFKVIGANLRDAAEAAGDFNGDGFDDILLESYYLTPQNARDGETAAVTVLFGDDTFAPVVDLDALTVGEGVTFVEFEERNIVREFSGIGDFNGDGIDDIAVRNSRDFRTAYDAEGSVKVIFGSDAGFALQVDQTTQTINEAVSFFDSGSQTDRSDVGVDIAEQGDFNGDGISDLLLGGDSGNNNDGGQAFVVFGSSTGFTADIDLASLDGTNGFKISGEGLNQELARQVTSPGDLNGDGFDDIVVGGRSTEDPETFELNKGQASVLFGRSSGFSSVVEIADFAALGGFTIEGANRFDEIARQLAAAGDLNGDGLDDFLISGHRTGVDLIGNFYYQTGGGLFVIYGTEEVTTPAVITGDLTIGVQTSGSTVIESADLSAVAAGTTAAELAFIVEETTNGFFALAAAPNSSIIRFTQAQVDAGEVIFINNGLGPGGAATLSAVDAEGDLSFPFVLTAQAVGAAIIDGDLTLEVLDGGITALTGDSVLGSEATRDATQIVFTATNITGGQLEVASNPGLAITSFTQAQIDARDVRFVDTDGMAGGSFDLTLTDLAGLTTTETITVEAGAAPRNVVEAETDLDGTNGFIAFDGVNAFGSIGRSVASAGDVNGDGVEDLIIGGYSSELDGQVSVGRAYVLFGDTVGFGSRVDLGLLDGTDGVAIVGVQSGELGVSVNGLGDVNGDGVDDVIARDLDGDAFVVFGSATSFASELSVGALDGSNGFQITGIGVASENQFSVSSAGDINGDGFRDILIGSYRADTNVGRAYVVFGTDQGFAASIDVGALDGTNGFTLANLSGGQEFGLSVAEAGDFNDDGFDDLIVGANNFSGATAGDDNVFVVYGTDQGFGASFDVSTLDGTNGFSVGPAVSTPNNVVISVAAAGDVNGDGVADIIIGDNEAASNYMGIGNAYVLFGGLATPTAGRFDLGDLDGNNGFRISGDVSAVLGISVAGVGDVNGDGVDDVAVADPYSYRNSPANDEIGEVFVIYGSTLGFDPLLNVSEIDEATGFIVQGGTDRASFGASVSNAVDINADGIDDFAIGAQFSEAANGLQEGAAFIILGQSVVDTPIINGDFVTEVTLGDTVTLTTFDLTASEQGSGPSDLLYHVTNVTGGFIANSDGPTTPLDRFGQDELESGQLFFVHDGSMSDGGFEFTVTDPEGDVSDVQAVSVELISAAAISGDLTLTVAVDGTVAIKKSDVLGAEDGISEDQITFTATNIQGGQLEFATAPGVVITSFTQADIDAFGVRFADDSVAGGSFDLSLTDASGVSVTQSVEVRTPFAPTSPLDVALLDGSDGFAIPGLVSDSDIGRIRQLSFAGDVNGDGLADFVLGDDEVSADGAANTGEAYVIFGDKGGFPAEFDLAALNGSNGFRINGAQGGDALGYTVAGVGDFNGDGFSDVAVTAEYADTAIQDPGVVHVIFGKAQGFAADVDINQLDPGDGFTIVGGEAQDFAGTALAGFGDVNGDGLSDLAIGAVFGGGAAGLFRSGEVYVLFGTIDPITADVDLGAITPAQGIRIDGAKDTDRIGYSLSIEGDLNGDGFDDIAIGSGNVNQPNGAGGYYYEAGAAYVVFGSDSLAAVTNLASLDGTNGFTVPGQAEFDELGYDIALVEDINGDGFDDFVVGAFFDSIPAEYYVGSAHVIFGTDAGFPASFDVSSLDGTNGFTLQGSGLREYVGFSVSGAGDFNGDGLNDLMVSAYNANTAAYADAGAVHIIYGSEAPFAAEITLDTLAPADGLTLTNSFGDNANLGSDVARTGDVNGDGAADVLVGVKDADPNAGGFGGSAFVVFGGEAAEAATIAGDLTSTVERGATVALTTDDIFASAPAQVGADFVYQVQSVANGFVAFAPNPTVAINRFTQTDLVEGLIIFAHDGAAAAGSFSVDVTDRQGDITALQAVTVALDTVNDPPVVDDQTFDVDEDDVLNGRVIAFDPDNTAAELTFTLQQSQTPLVGALSLNLSGFFDYTPAADFNGTETFNVLVSDGAESDTATITINVAAVADDPRPADDQFATDEETQFSGDLFADNGFGVDVEVDGEAFSLVAIDGGAIISGATLTLSSGALLTARGDGTFDYDPVGAFDFVVEGDIFGDQFTYTVRDDSGAEATATAFIDINGVNDDPVIQSLNFTTNEDVPLIDQIIAFDPDAAQGELVFSLAQGGDPVLGGLTLGTDGGFTYTPFADISGFDSFDVLVTDAFNGADLATIQLEILSVPDDPRPADDNFATDEDTAISGDLFADNGNGADEEADEEDFTLVAIDGVQITSGQPVTLASGALLTARSDGTFDYDPSGAFDALADSATGSDQFTYTVRDDSGAEATATAFVDINGVNDDPVIQSLSFTTDEDVALVDQIIVFDPDAAPAELVFTQQQGQGPVLGDLTLGSDGGFTYTPFADTFGLDSFDVLVEDGFSGSDFATIQIEILSIPDDPRPEDDSFATDEDTAISSDLFADNGNGPDVEVEEEAFTLVAIDGAQITSGQPVTLTSGALLTARSDGTFDYDPSGAFDSLGGESLGSDQFTYTVRDSSGAEATAMATIEITGRNDAPVIQSLSFTTDEDVPLIDQLIILDPDAGPRDLTVSLAQGSDTTLGALQLNADGSFIYTPNANIFGLDSFDVEVIDDFDARDAATIEIEILSVQDAPTPADDRFATDQSNAILGDLFADNGAGPDVDDDGDAFSVVAVDGAAAQVGVPFAGEFTASSGQIFSGFLVTVLADGSFTFDPAGAFDSLPEGVVEEVAISYTVEDATGLQSTATITVDVTGLNDAPIAAPDAVTVEEAADLTVLPLADNGAGPDIDPDGDALTIASIEGQPVVVGDVVTLASGAEVELSSPTEVAYRQNDAFAGLEPLAEASDSFNYTITDGGELTDTETVAITITGQVPPPVAADDAVAGDEDTPFAIDLFADNGGGVDVDFAAAGLTITAINDAAVSGGAATLASGAILSLTGDGGVVYDPAGAFETLAEGETTADSFVYTVADDLGQTDDATVDVAITGRNDAPVAQPDAFRTDEATTVAGVLLADNGAGADTDIDGGALSVLGVGDGGLGAVTLASGAVVTVAADGVFVYDPNEAFDELDTGETAEDSFIYRLSDGQGGETEGVATITIEGLANQIVGTDGDDLLIGTVDGDDMDGRGGNDLITGLEDDDLLAGGTGSDVVRGGTGDDTVNGGAGDDLLFGEGGADIMEGGLGDDRLTGAGGADTLFGGDGEDTLAGGGNDDRLVGGADADLLRGGRGADTLVGSAGGDRLRGGRDDDLLRGGGGRDLLDGAAGDDVMMAGGGRDTLLGGAGNDSLSGGAGSDVFLFDASDGVDLITDFQQGFDSIRIRAFNADFGDLAINQQGEDVVIGFRNTTIRVEDQIASDFDADDFIF